MREQSTHVKGSLFLLLIHGIEQATWIWNNQNCKWRLVSRVFWSPTTVLSWDLSPLGLSLLICKLRGVPALLSLRTLRTQKISLLIGKLFLEDKSLKGWKSQLFWLQGGGTGAFPSHFPSLWSQRRKNSQSLRKHSFASPNPHTAHCSNLYRLWQAAPKCMRHAGPWCRSQVLRGRVHSGLAYHFLCFAWYQQDYSVVPWLVGQLVWRIQNPFPHMSVPQWRWRRLGSGSIVTAVHMVSPAPHSCTLGHLIWGRPSGGSYPRMSHPSP